MKLYRHYFYFSNAIFNIVFFFVISVAFGFYASESLPVDQVFSRIVWGALSLLSISFFFVYRAKRNSFSDYWEYKDRVISYPKIGLSKSLEGTIWISSDRPAAPTDSMPFLGKGLRDPSKILCIIWQKELLMINAQEFPSFESFFEVVLQDFNELNGSINELNSAQIDALKYKSFNEIHRLS